MQELPLSARIQELRYSVIREMGGLAATFKDVINLGIGEPDFDTPAIIIKRALLDAEMGHTHYTHSQGDSELLAKIATTLEAQGICVQRSAIIVTHGGMGALTAALRTILNQDDQVLLLEPHFPDYLGHIALAQGKAINVPSCFEDGFLPRIEQIEQAITPFTKALILNSPNNPTGAVLPAKLLDAIADIAIRHNLVVISDEVYDQILFDPPCESIFTRPSMPERTVVIKSFSKSYAMTGWRVGYCYGPQALMDQMIKVVNYSTACASSIGQRAALAALDIDPAIIARMRDTFASRVEYVCRRLDGIPGIRVAKPKGSFYIFPDISEITGHSRNFALDLLQEKKVLVIPGYAFGKSGEGFIRIACTKEKPVLEDAMDRLESFVEMYRKC